MREIPLHETRSTDGSRTVWATYDDAGSLSIEGQSLSRSADFFEYEWAFTVDAEHLPALVSALGGQPGDDVTVLLRALFAADSHPDLRDIFQRHDIPFRFWSRVGD